jgi:hypothetical protein
MWRRVIRRILQLHLSQCESIMSYFVISIFPAVSTSSPSSFSISTGRSPRTNLKKPVLARFIISLIRILFPSESTATNPNKVVVSRAENRYNIFEEADWEGLMNIIFFRRRITKLGDLFILLGFLFSNLGRLPTGMAQAASSRPNTASNCSTIYNENNGWVIDICTNYSTVSTPPGFGIRSSQRKSSPGVRLAVFVMRI